MSGVIRALQSFVVQSANVATDGMKIASTATRAGLEATEGWAADRKEVLEAGAFSRRLDLLERVREDARRACLQGLDPTKVMSLNFQECLSLAVKDLENQRQIKFEPLD